MDQKQPNQKTEIPAAEQHSATQKQQNGDLLQLVMNSIPQFVFWKDTQFTYLGCNEQFAKAAGLDHPDDIVGLSDFDLPWKRKEADFYRLCDERVMENDRAEYNIIEQQLQADGQQLWLRTNKIPLHDGNGTVIGILGTYEDISEDIETEERLKHYEIITSTVDDLMAIIGHDYCLRAVNSAYLTAYARTREEIIGSYVGDITESGIFEQILKPNIDRALAGHVRQFEGWRVFPGLGRRYVQYTYYPIFDESERVNGIVAKVHDNTTTRKLEAQLQQSQKMEAIGRLAGGIAHDFNNILSVINGYSDLCLFDMTHDDPYRNRLEQINESGRRAARLTQQLLAFSRKQIIQPQPLNLADEIRDINRMLERLLGEHIEIELIVDEQLQPAVMDRSQFEQVVLNLCVNAKDAMPNGGKLTIEIRNHTVSEEYEAGRYAVLTGDYVKFSLTDTGQGMNPKTMARIFEPFFTTKPKETGTGLGLSTVYGIIKQNKGYVSVYSELDKGTTFQLLFPRSTETIGTIQARAETESSELIKGTGTILLVEDDTSLRNMCVTILKELGYTVLEAGNGQEAIDSASRFHGKIDLLLTDVVMPGINGPETARILSSKHNDLRVLFMSGYTEDAIVQHGVLDEGIHFMQKPITPKVLSREVHSILNGDG